MSNRVFWGTLLAVEIGIVVVGGIVVGAGGHAAWYASRAAGFAAYFSLWIALAGGLLMSSAWVDGIVARARLLAIHQTAGLVGLGFAAGHALVLLLDSYIGYSVVDLLVPFAASHERTLTGLGVVTLYLTALVTLSFWVRTAIGMRVWRMVHYLSVVAFLGAAWHGMQMGTSADFGWGRAVYLITTLSLVTATVVRAVYVRPTRRTAKAAGGVSAG